MSKDYRNTNQLISGFCEIILTRNDDLNHNDATNYIKSLTNEEISLLNSCNLDENCSIVRNMLMAYIQSYQIIDGNPDFISPFEFDSGNNFERYKEYFELEYKKRNNQADIPRVFVRAFELIQEMSEHYRVFEQFYSIRSFKADDSLLAKLEVLTEKKAKDGAEAGVKASIDQVIKDVQKAAEKATEEAKINSKVAAEQAENASQNAKEAASKAVGDAIKDKMNEVTKNISETSVTILGIFAGIVLTVVAGLFYSSSVINNINSASFYKLMSISALVGFVCINLMAIMFYYVERIKNKGESKMSHFSWVILSINLVLIIAMVWFGVLQSHTSNNVADSHLEKAVVDVNITTLNDENHPDASGANNSIEENAAPNKSTLNPEENTSKDKV